MENIPYMIKTNTEAYGEFTNYLVRQGLVKENIKNTLWMLSRIKNKTLDGFKSYLLELCNAGKSGSYYNKHVQAMKHYLRFNKVSEDIIAEIKQISANSREYQTFTDKQVDDFLALGDITKPSGMFFELVANHGTRLGEIRNLRKRDFNLARETMTVKGKNGYRTIPIYPPLLESITSYLNKCSDYLFPHRDKLNCPMTHAGYRKDFVKRLKKLGITDPNVVPYSFRHTFATKAVEEQAMDIKNLAGLMGSSEVTILKRYVHKNVKMMRRGMMRLTRTINKSSLEEKLAQVANFAKEIGLLDDKRIVINQTKNQLVLQIET